MPTPDEVLTFHDVLPPDGASPLVEGALPDLRLVLCEYDETWPNAFTSIAQRVREALGFRVLALEHVGSTAVPGLAAKPIIDLDLVVADPDSEEEYVPALQEAGFVLRIREPWWYRHRMLRLPDPSANLHVWGLDSPEPLRHTIFRDWLRLDAGDRSLYLSAKRDAARTARERGEDVNGYNERKSSILREIYSRAFTAAGLLRETDPATTRP